MFLTNLSLDNVNPKKDVLDSISLRHFSAIDSVSRSIELFIREGLRLVEAVEYMHSRKVDIKESNIFV